MFKIERTSGDIHFPDGSVLSMPYEDQRYFEYAEWVQSGNSPEEFSAVQPVYVPESVSRFQARAALYQAGVLTTIEAMMADPATPALHRLAWQDAQEFRRDSVLVGGMAQVLGLTSEQLDDLFRLASTVTA